MPIWLTIYTHIQTRNMYRSTHGNLFGIVFIYAWVVIKKVIMFFLEILRLFSFGISKTFLYPTRKCDVLYEKSTSSVHDSFLSRRDDVLKLLKPVKP